MKGNTAKRAVKASVPRERKTTARIRLHNSAPEDLSERKSPSKLVKGMFRNKIDQDLIRKNVRLSARLRKVLAAASPQSTVDLISGIAVDLADFWEIGEEHRRRVKSLSKMQFPKDRGRFEDLLYEFEIRLVVHAEWHAKHLKRRLAKLKHDLEK